MPQPNEYVHTMRCERCGETFGEKDFRGEVCAWCAADLEKADQVEADN